MSWWGSRRWKLRTTGANASGVISRGLFFFWLVLCKGILAELIITMVYKHQGIRKSWKHIFTILMVNIAWHYCWQQIKKKSHRPELFQIWFALYQLLKKTRRCRLSQYRWLVSRDICWTFHIAGQRLGSPNEIGSLSNDLQGLKKQIAG